MTTGGTETSKKKRTWIRKKNAGLPPSLFLSSIHPRPPKWSLRGRPGAMIPALGRRRVDLYWFFVGKKRHRKIDPDGRINLGAQSAFFGQKNTTCGIPFCIDLLRFLFFRKLQKCVFSEEYFVFRGSGPLKYDNFPIQMSLNFHVFFKHPPREHFWRARVPI